MHESRERRDPSVPLASSSLSTRRCWSDALKQQFVRRILVSFDARSLRASWGRKPTSRGGRLCHFGGERNRPSPLGRVVKFPRVRARRRRSTDGLRTFGEKVLDSPRHREGQTTVINSLEVSRERRERRVTPLTVRCANFSTTRRKMCDGYDTGADRYDRLSTDKFLAKSFENLGKFCHNFYSRQLLLDK